MIFHDFLRFFRESPTHTQNIKATSLSIRPKGPNKAAIPTAREKKAAVATEEVYYMNSKYLSVAKHYCSQNEQEACFG
jgi:hypothetical protein